ncbi:MAG: protein-L-isoaspartate O-methyltransferase [Gammaproteobacteria bacterium]|nr:protein-L-isoaspartate O-methyltransferase [Gammaproteobacteria bacterium]
MELKAARFNMIEQQIRPWDVLDQGVLDLIGEIPREDFVPEPYRGLAYADTAIPLGHGQVMMHPRIEGRLLQALDLHATDTVLEIGTGSGYLTALLARSAYHVYSVDIIPHFKEQAEERLAVHGIGNVTLEVGDAARGWPRHGLYDAIAITGSLPELPCAFLQSLNRGGRLFAVVGAAPIMEAVLIRRVGDAEWSRESLFETDLPMLINAQATARFVF